MAEAAKPASKKDPLLRIGVHEFSTPVSVILGYLRMLMTGRTGNLTDMQRKILEEMDKSTTRLGRLIEEMRDVNRLEAGEMTFNRGVVDLGALIADEVASLPAQAELDVHVTLENNAPSTKVHGDPVRLRAVVTSLMVAHRRELVTSGELRVCIDRATQNGSRMLRVTFAGADRIAELRNVPAEQLAPLEEFRSGIGFALAIARRIVAAHGGQLWAPPVESKAGAILFLPEA